MVYKIICLAIVLLSAGQNAIARIYPEGQNAEQPQNMQDQRVRFGVRNSEDDVRHAVNTPFEYAYVYNQNLVRLLAEKVNEKVGIIIPFHSNGPMTLGITHALNSSEIVLTKPGVYQVNFIGVAALHKSTSSFSSEQPTVALFLNEQPVEGTSVLISSPGKKPEQIQSVNSNGGGGAFAFGALVRQSQPSVIRHDERSICLQAIIMINAGDVLTVKSRGTGLVNGDIVDIRNASMIIRQLAS